MTKTDYIIFKSTANRVEYFQENKFDKYVIIDYVDGVINKVRSCELCTDELLTHLFDIRQKVLLDKKI